MKKVMVAATLLMGLSFVTAASARTYWCGGYWGYGCPRNMICVDYENDYCDPEDGDRYCWGTCVYGQYCGGIMARPCADTTKMCVDDPMDNCDPDNGGADCRGICVNAPTYKFCGGFANIQCAEGYWCVENPRDNCDPANGGADCGGICVDPWDADFCGGIASFQCDEGYYCVDDPSDSCDPANGGADCSGMCI